MVVRPTALRLPESKLFHFSEGLDLVAKVLISLCNHALCTITVQNSLLHGSHTKWKTWKNEKTFPVREKSGNFEQTGKVRGFYPKYWKNEGILPKILEK